MSDFPFLKILMVSVLLCGYTQAQSQPSKVQTSKKPKVKISKVEPDEPPPAISKEFMPIARRAFQSLDNLNEHFFEDYDSDTAWTPRQMAAEKSRDDLEAVANTSMEKFIFSLIDNYLGIVTGDRTLMKSEDKIGDAYNARRTRERIDSDLKGLFKDDCYAYFKKLATTGEREMGRCGSNPTKESGS